MSHKRDCPSPEYARQRGRDEWRSGWYSPYAMGDCRDAQQSYDDGMREERRSQERRRQARAEEEQAEIDAYAAADQQRQYEEQMRAEEEAHFAELMEAQQAAEGASHDGKGAAPAAELKS